MSVRRKWATIVMLVLTVTLSGCDLIYQDPPLTFTPGALPDAHVGQAYDQ